MKSNNSISLVSNKYLYSKVKTKKFTFKKVIFSNLCKKYLKIFFSTLSILILKIAITYNFYVSNVFIIKIFNKTVDIAQLFSNYYILLKYLYYLLFAIITFYILLKLSNLFNLKKELNKTTIGNSDNLISIGKSNNDRVVIHKEGLYQNVLITGSIGSGKTTSAITTLLYKLVKSGVCGLILDVKGDYINIVNEIARICGKEDDIIEISLKSKFSYNPLDKPYLSNVELAYMIRKVLEMLSENNLSDTFWMDKSESYIASFITLMKTYMDIINFKELHMLVTNISYLKSVLKNIKKKILNENISDDILFEINNAINNIENEYLKLDCRTLSIIRAEITRVTNVFVSNYQISEKFASKSDKLDFYSNKIYVLSFNIAENRKLAKVISTYLKFDFQNKVLSNHSNKSVFFVCDEYQEFANAEDAHFLSLSRQYRCINIVSMQSYTSLINALKSEKSATVIIQNLVNKIWLRNDDIYTIEQIIKQIGKEEKQKKTLSYGEEGHETRYNIFSNGFLNRKSNLSQSYSVTNSIENVLNDEYFSRNLKTYEAVCLLSDGVKMKLYTNVFLEKVNEIVNGGINEKNNKS